MTPPLGSHYSGLSPVGQDAPPTMRADLLSDEYRAPCSVCDGRVTIHRIQQTSYGWRGECTEHETDVDSGRENAL